MRASSFARATVLFAPILIAPLWLHAQPCDPPDARAYIVATDGAGAADTLWFGYDPLATCGVDTGICGENLEFPPPPPPGIFYAYWVHFRCEKNLKFDYVDYRDPTAVDTHMVRWETVPAIFRWDPDSIRAICDSAVFVDLFSGILVRVRMDIDSGITVYNPVVGSAFIIRYGARPPVGVQDPGSTPPQFRLEQNFPNPFNPATTIAFTIPYPDFVKLSVVNLLGQPVAILAEGNYDAGRHSVQWDASELSAGMYFYRLVLPDYRATGKCILVK